MNEVTKDIVEEFMAEHKISTHTEAVRRIVLEHHQQTSNKEKELEAKLFSMGKELSIVTQLSVFMAESMHAIKYEKATSDLYKQAKEEVEKDIKRRRSHSRLMINE